MRILMTELVERPDGILAGAINGMRDRAQILERIVVEPIEADPLFLDFRGVNVATASYLRETFFKLRDEVRQRHSNYYPVIANANDLVAEELRLLVATRGGAVMLCALDNDAKPRDARLLGQLDPKQQFTFEEVRKRGETDAGELMRDYGVSENTKAQTAWNNRLSALATLGLIIELSQGRAKRYRPLFAEG